MNETFDVIVIGVGAMGACACWQLAQRAVKVLGIERFAIPHAMGSSHGFSRMIRKAYYEHPDYVPLVQRAYALWDELEAQTGHKLLFRTGGIYMGAPEGEVVRGATAAAKLHRLPHEVLSREEIAKRFPPFNLPDGV